MRWFIIWALALALSLPANAQFGGGGTVSPCSGDLNTSCQVTNLHLGVSRVLCSIRAANFNTTSDQSCVIPASVTVVLGLTLAANIATTRQTVNTVYLSLTTGTGGAATCDFYVVGNDLT